MIVRYTFLLFLTFFLSFNANSQKYQRMQIPAQNITLKPSGTSYADSYCVDAFRDIPTLKTKLNQVLVGLNSAKVYVNGSSQPEELVNYLNSENIEIKGANETEYVRFVNNNPNINFRIDLKEPIQVSQIKEEPKAFRGDNQDEIWENEINDFIKDELEYDIYPWDLLEYRKLNPTASIEDLRIIKFSLEHGIESISEFRMKLKEEIEKKREREKLEALKKKQLEQERVKLEGNKASLYSKFQKDDIGLYDKKLSLTEMVDNYAKAKEKAFRITSSDEVDRILNSYKEDFQARIYYKWNEAESRYLIYHRHKKLPKILVLKTDYYNSYQDRLIDNIFTRKVNNEKVHILNLFGKEGYFNKDNKYVSEQIEKLFPTNHSHFEIEELPKLAKVFNDSSIEYLVVFAHFGKNVVCPNVECIPPFSINAIQNMLKGTGIELILIGCKSSIYSAGQTGTTHIVNTTPMLNSLNEALTSTSNFGDFLISMANDSNMEFLFTLRFDEKEQMVIFESEEKFAFHKLIEFNNEDSAGSNGIAPKQFFEIRMPLNLINQTTEDDNRKEN